MPSEETEYRFEQDAIPSVSDKPGRSDRRAQHLAAVRGQLKDTVTMSAEHERACVEDDDDFDAFVCALVARAAQVGHTDPIPLGMRWLAMREGWIHLPAPGSLQQLAAAQP